MKKWMNVCLMLLVSTSLTLTACGDEDDDDQDAGQDTTVSEDAGDIAEDTDEPDTTEGDAADTTADGVDTTDCDPDEENLYAFSGSLDFHPLTEALDQEATLADAEFSIAAALSLIGGGEATYLEDDQCQQVFTSWGSDFGESTAEWAFDAVDISVITPGMGAAVGLAGHLDEQPEDPKFLRTATGLAAMPIEEDVTGVQAYAITMETEAALVDIMAGESDKIRDPGDLASLGFVVLQFFDAEGNPASNVTVTTGGHNSGGDDCSADSGDRVEDAYYPSSDYTAVEVGPCASTSDHGIAILPEFSFSSSVTGVNVEDGTEFGTQPAASTANTAFVGFRAPAE